MCLGIHRQLGGRQRRVLDPHEGNQIMTGGTDCGRDLLPLLVIEFKQSSSKWILRLPYTLPLGFTVASNATFQCTVFICYMREGGCGNSVFRCGTELWSLLQAVGKLIPLCS